MVRAMKRIAPVGITVLALSTAAALGAEADPGQGARVFRACVACHSLEANRNMTGPSLAGVWNRKAGGLASFTRYSDAMKLSGITWDEQSLQISRHKHPGSSECVTRLAVGCLHFMESDDHGQRGWQHHCHHHDHPIRNEMPCIAHGMRHCHFRGGVAVPDKARPCRCHERRKQTQYEVALKVE